MTSGTSLALRAARPGTLQTVRVAICAAGELWGGVEQCIVTLVEGLGRTRFSPVAVLFTEGLLAERLRSCGVDVHCLQGSRRDVRTIFHLRDLLAREHVQLLHVHGYKATVVGTMARRGLGIPIVKTEHGLPEPCHRWGDLWQHRRSAANHLLERIASRTVDARVFVSRDLRRRLNGDGRRSHLIYNGIDIADVSVAPVRRPQNEFHIAIVGRVSAVKGHRYLLGALTRLRDAEHVRLHVFGSGELETDCRRFCDEHGLSSTVVFHGFTETLRREISGMDLIVMPSLHEGLPYTLLEAMVAGVPVLASAVGGLKEVLEQEECGVLVPPADEAALAAAIDRLRRDPRERARLAARGRRAVKERFSAAAMSQQYATVYESVLEERA